MGGRKISLTMSLFMVLTALLFDALSLIPLLGIVTDLLAWLIFFFWFMVLGISFTKNKKLMRNSLIAFIIGFIPILNMLPEITLAVVLNIWNTNHDNKPVVKNNSSYEDNSFQPTKRISTPSIPQE